MRYYFPLLENVGANDDIEAMDRHLSSEADSLGRVRWAHLLPKAGEELAPTFTGIPEDFHSFVDDFV